MTLQTMRGRARRKLLGAAVAACTLASGLIAQSVWASDTGAWPDRPIRIVVPFAPGGSNDHIARRIALYMGESLGKTVVVENRGGAAGVVGSAVVANSQPDGYTYLFVSASLATSAATQNPPYDTVKDFAAVGRVAQAPFVFLTRKDFPAKTLPEFIDYAKKNPDTINYGTTGAGDSGHILTELFGSMAGVKMQQVGYKGVNPAQMDLVAGRIDFMITTLASIGGQPAGELPKLAFTGKQRDPNFPDVPTVREATGLDYEVAVWWGLFAPAGTPDPILDKMNAELNRIAALPDFKVFLAGLGADSSPSSREEMMAQLSSDVDSFVATVKNSGINVASK